MLTILSKKKLTGKIAGLRELIESFEPQALQTGVKGILGVP